MRKIYRIRTIPMYLCVCWPLWRSLSADNCYSEQREWNHEYVESG